jgi:hypothetical protein
MTEIPDSPFLASQVAFSRSKSIEPRIKISITRRKKKKKTETHLRLLSISVTVPILQFSPFGGRLLPLRHPFLIQANKADCRLKKDFG